MKSPGSGFLWFFLLPVFCFAQIEVTDQDVYKLDQAVGIYENSNWLFNLSVDLKTDGPDQMWDFTNLEMGDSTTFTRYEFLKTKGTRYENVFPQANYMHVESIVDDTTYSYASFIRASADSFQILGSMDQDFINGEFDIKNHGDNYYFPLPLKYDTSWTNIRIDSLGEWGVVTTNMHKTVDAWGTLKLPAGTFDCLRMRIITKDSSDWAVHWFIQYMFISKENILLAIVQGMPDDTTHNFSEALYVQRFYDISTTRIEDKIIRNRVPKAFHLKQNYPNPFNPSTKLIFNVPEYERIELVVYNIYGERVKTLYSGYLNPGTYTSRWQGTDSGNQPMPSGVYLCQLRSQNFHEVIRMMLVR